MRTPGGAGERREGGGDALRGGGGDGLLASNMFIRNGLLKTLGSGHSRKRKDFTGSNSPHWS